MKQKTTTTKKHKQKTKYHKNSVENFDRILLHLFVNKSHSFEIIIAKKKEKSNMILYHGFGETTNYKYDRAINHYFLPFSKVDMNLFFLFFSIPFVPWNISCNTNSNNISQPLP